MENKSFAQRHEWFCRYDAEKRGDYTSLLLVCLINDGIVRLAKTVCSIQYSRLIAKAVREFIDRESKAGVRCSVKDAIHQIESSIYCQYDLVH